MWKVLMKPAPTMPIPSRLLMLNPD
jgi:hypothetical protein